MSLIILCGLDKTGKSTVAAYYESLGYQVIHQSAPRKGITKDEYLQEQIDIITSAAAKDVILDRSYYGELIWPKIYDRSPMLDSDDLEMLREIEESVGTKRILMTDNNVEAHWKRCVDNNEPLTKLQFTKARSLYSNMAQTYDFEVITLQQFLKQFPDAEQFTVTVNSGTVNHITIDNAEFDITSTRNLETGSVRANDATQAKYPQKTKEQLTLEKANAINDILSKPILKSKGDIYLSLETDIRKFLNAELGKLLGNKQEDTVSFSKEEIVFYKNMFKRAMEK